VVDATMRGIEHPESLVDVFNVGSGVATDVLTIADTLRHLLGGKSEISVSGQFRTGDIRHNLADLKKISQVLGYAPKVSMNDGLRRFVDWVRGEHVESDRYEESLEELRVKGLFK
jgi:dTDP-L-rhamnose 4-epimerase